MFFLIVFSIYAVGNLYLFLRGWQAFEIMGRQRIWFTLLFWLAALSFIVTQVLQRQGASGLLFHAYHTIGSFWIAVMLYGFLILLAIDILRIIGWAGNIRPEFIYRNYSLTKAILFGAVCLVISIILAAGYSNVCRLRATHLKIAVDKKAGQLKGLRVVMVSDIHLGHINGSKSLARIVDAINEQHPDIVLLAGDTFDGSPETVIKVKNDICMDFNRLQTKYGTFIVSGNHEYFGERGNRTPIGKNFDNLVSLGVQPLLDSVVLIDESFYVAGRKDRSAGMRKTIHELLQGADRQLPVILLDHQPYELEKAEQARVDLQLSGHTHHGQMWPLNYLIRKMYEKDWGYLQKGKSNFYISCGVGTWGPPIRTAGFSEVVVIDLEFN